MSDILSKLLSNPEKVNIDYLINNKKNILNSFKEPIQRNYNFVSYKTNNSYLSSSYNELSYQVIEKSISKFFENKKFLNAKQSQKGYLYSYVSKALKNLAFQKISEYHLSNRKLVNVCPACKYYGNKSYLIVEDKKLSCKECELQINLLKEQIESISDITIISKIKTRKALHEAFLVHSGAGYDCPDCHSFIPKSYFDNYGSCPYPTCGWFGEVVDLKTKSHPKSLACSSIYLNLGDISSKINKNHDSNITDEDVISLIENKSESSTITDLIIFKEKILKEKNILKSVIELQKKRLEQFKSFSKSYKDLFMYQAFLNMVEKEPEDMITYLVHKKKCDTAIQSKIFQEYASVIENNMPLIIKKNGKNKEILSLIDKDLNLFLGISEFESEVLKSGIINNNTKEEYIGSLTMKMYGPCYIGYLIDVEDINLNKSLLNNVERYSFSKIYTKNINFGTKVKVSHFRIASHDELGPLVHLQKIRKKIVTSLESKFKDI